MKKVKTDSRRKSQIQALKKMKDQDINLDDIPEILDWSKGVRGKFYRPVKQAISIRVDADVLTWFRTRSGKYQSKMNEALREYMQKRRRA
ncbi:BrnA antitoxin family protein [Sulfuricaulis sp.]|uniref:BrnA antitoxin family protein n=1 Tax=Sulfuricaulis sp. TaxID=2003553 RepID=UPI003C794B32